MATLVLVLLLTLFMSAGIWQLDRAGQKHDLNAQFMASSIVDHLDAPIDEADIDTYRYRMIRLYGRYDSAHQILLDNIVSSGQNGYQVLTPFYSSGKVLLVNRGWVPADPDRGVLPDIGVAEEMRTITARINSLPVPGMRLPADPATAGSQWPKRLLYPTREQIVAALEKTVPDYQLLLAETEADGFRRIWKAVDVGPEKHYGYAFQWFSFAAIALFFYVLLNVRWKQQHQKSTPAETEDE